MRADVRRGLQAAAATARAEVAEETAAAADTRRRELASELSAQLALAQADAASAGAQQSATATALEAVRADCEARTVELASNRAALLQSEKTLAATVEGADKAAAAAAAQLAEAQAAQQRLTEDVTQAHRQLVRPLLAFWRVPC